MHRVNAERHPERDVIVLRYAFDREINKLVKEVPGWRFIDKDNGGPYWTVPLTLTSGRRLRELFGPGLKLGPKLLAWGRDEVQRERNLKSLTVADDAELERLPAGHAIARAIAGDPLPELGAPPKHPLNRQRDPRPYQRADIAMMAAENVINANGMGTGKTLEWLGAIIEGGFLDGPHLVVAPVKSLENVWQVEVARFLGLPVYTGEKPAKRKQQVTAGVEAAGRGEACVVAVNPDMLRLKRLPKLASGKKRPNSEVAKRDFKGNEYAYGNDLTAALLGVEWNTVVIDEFHKAGLNNEKSLFSLGVSLMKSRRRCAMSGTPMGGKPIKLYPVFKWLNPSAFPSKWRWAEEWLEISDNGFGKSIGGFQPTREAEFYAAHARYMVRRLKSEALPGLPERVIDIVMAPMSPKQSKQYKAFQRDAEIRIDGERLGANIVLAEYTRLKQFANAAQRLGGGEPYPLPDSGKLPLLLEKLDESGVRKVDPEPGARAIIASESKRMVEMVVEWLRGEGIDADALTGDTKETKPLLDRFDADDEAPYVIVMTTQTGGVSLNLEAADSVHALDEMWNPDDMDQLFDRGDRGGRTTPLKVFIYRTKDTVQEYIAEVAGEKAITNRNILDVHRQLFRQQSES